MSWRRSYERLSPPLFHESRRCSVAAVLESEDDRILSIAKPACGPHDRVKHRLQVERRAANDLQHLACRCLLLQRLVPLTGELSHVGLCFVVGRGWIA